MPILQKIVTLGRRLIPRGWSFFLARSASLYKPWQQYYARMDSGDFLYLDLRETMCHGYFFHAGQPYEKGTELLLRQYLHQGDVFIDVGANVGYYTRIASKLVGDEGCVFAFEPMPAAFALLQQNSADLGNTILYPTAVGNQVGQAVFSIRKQGNLSSLGHDAQAKETTTVSVTQLDQALAGLSRVDFIKIDVEEHEFAVLEGAKVVIQKHKPLVYFEYLAQFDQVREQDLSDFASFFQLFNYTLQWINHDHPESPLLSNVPSTYLVAFPEERRHRLSG